MNMQEKGTPRGTNGHNGVARDLTIDFDAVSLDHKNLIPDSSQNIQLKPMQKVVPCPLSWKLAQRD